VLWINSDRIVTYSPAYTLVPTYECFNRCQYCNFRVDPGQSAWLSLVEAEARLRLLKAAGGVAHQSPAVIELLVLSGEVHPQSARRAAWFQHLYNLCELALALGFLPHTNAGPLSRAEMERLKAVNVSMGLMLEQVTPTLLETVHRHAPSKLPSLRLQQLEWAGEFKIPFTTGLLLGVGETPADRVETLTAIAQSYERWGHIQEVILQPYSPGQTETWSSEPFRPEDLIDITTVARRILPAEITLQIPPNLLRQPQQLIACLEAGARDLGGIGPHDEVNPDYPHPTAAGLAKHLATDGWQLVPRLPIYPQYDDWLPTSLKSTVCQWREILAQGNVA